jgi:hypothetical protein
MVQYNHNFKHIHLKERHTDLIVTLVKTKFLS